METASESEEHVGGREAVGGGVRAEATLIYAVCGLAGSRERCLCVGRVDGWGWEYRW